MHLAGAQLALEAAGAALGSVVKLTTYVTDIAHVRIYGQVRDELVAGPPAGTVVQVGALAVPGMMLEVEASAVVGDRGEAG